MDEDDVEVMVYGDLLSPTLLAKHAKKKEKKNRGRSSSSESDKTGSKKRDNNTNDEPSKL